MKFPEKIINTYINSVLEAAGRAVLMANAPEDLKLHALERGWRLGGRHDEDAVAQAIYHALDTLNTATIAVPSGTL